MSEGDGDLTGEGTLIGEAVEGEKGSGESVMGEEEREGKDEPVVGDAEVEPGPFAALHSLEVASREEREGERKISQPQRQRSSQYSQSSTHQRQPRPILVCRQRSLSLQMHPTVHRTPDSVRQLPRSTRISRVNPKNERRECLNQFDIVDSVLEGLAEESVAKFEGGGVRGGLGDFGGDGDDGAEEEGGVSADPVLRVQGGVEHRGHRIQMLVVAVTSSGWSARRRERRLGAQTHKANSSSTASRGHTPADTISSNTLSATGALICASSSTAKASANECLGASSVLVPSNFLRLNPPVAGVGAGVEAGGGGAEVTEEVGGSTKFGKAGLRC